MIPLRDIISSGVVKKYCKKKDEIRVLLQKRLSKVSMTFDLWRAERSSFSRNYGALVVGKSQLSWCCSRLRPLSLPSWRTRTEARDHRVCGGLLARWANYGRHCWRRYKHGSCIRLSARGRWIFKTDSCAVFRPLLKPDLQCWICSAEIGGGQSESNCYENQQSQNLSGKPRLCSNSLLEKCFVLFGLFLWDYNILFLFK